MIGSLFPLCLLLVFLSVVIVRTENYITCVASFSLFSLLISLVYLLLGAPDVAITEISINSCLSAIIMLCAGSLVNFDLGKKTRILPLVFTIPPVLGFFFIIGLKMPIFGESAVTDSSYIYIESTINNIGISNVITAVLASFRGFDTLWETVVVFSAGLSLVSVLKIGRH